LDKNHYLIELSESERTDFGRIDFTKLSDNQKVFSAVWALESQVNNGGFGQYFRSSDCDTANYAPVALRTSCADIVRRALDVVSSSPLPLLQEECEALIDDLDEERSSHLAALDDEFFKYPDNLTELLYVFVAAHPDDFDSASDAS
jgi:hypothetical protein